MECKNCGNVLPENAKFCFECGTKVEKEIVCSFCGTKLVPDAKFCMECGEKIAHKNVKVQDNTSYTKNEEDIDWDELLAGLASPNGITGILSKFSPIATPAERYGYGYKQYSSPKALYTVYNNGWIFRYGPCDEPYLFEENGNRMEKFDIKDLIRPNNDPYLLGMNNRGIWFDVGIDGETIEFVCVNFETNEQKRLKVTKRRKVIRKYYIVGSKVYYVAELDNGKQEFVVVDIDTGAECVLYKTSADEAVKFICATETRVAFGTEVAGSYNMNYWYGNVQEGEVPEFKKLGTIGDEIKIQFINLRQKIIWTTMTEKECARFNGEKWDLIGRPLEDPTEFKVLTYRERNTPLIYKVPNSYQNKIVYFDGEDAYASRYGCGVTRIDREGNTYEIGPFLHGNGETILVTDDYVYVDYNAQDGVVRLPRKFHGTKEEFVSANPEAEIDFAQSRWGTL